MTSAGERDDTTAAAKAALRVRLLAARRARSPVQLAAARADVVRHVLAALGPEVRVVAAYEALATEPGSLRLLEALAASGRAVLVPVTLPDRDLGWRVWTGGGAPSGEQLDRAAIARADVVLVPALAVGPDGTRLGRGGGSYDRALPRARGRLVALLHDGELLPEVPAAAHDVPVAAAVTPRGWVEFG